MSTDNPKSYEEVESTNNASIKLSKLDIAIKLFEHAQQVTQARLYNFLMAESLLILSWTTLFVGAGQRRDALFVCIAISILGGMLSFFWTILGFRHKKFLLAHSEIIDQIENSIPDHLRIFPLLAELNKGAKITIGSVQLQLSSNEKRFNEVFLGIAAPIGLIIINLILLGVVFV
jgi:hypothetical protein